MKTITKFIYAALAVVIVAMGAVTANGALGDLSVSVNAGTTNNGGGFIYQYTPTGVQSIFASNLSRPRGLAFDSAGNLFVETNAFDGTFFTATILKITPGGVQSLFFSMTSSFFFQALAIDRLNNVFVMAEDGNSPVEASTIYEFTPGGVQSTFGSLPWPRVRPRL